MYIHEQFGFSVQSIYRRFMTQSDADLGTYPDSFPNNIKEYFWVQSGQPTVKPWIALGEITNGLYFYYSAFSTREDSRFYVNTITEEVEVPKPEPVKVYEMPKLIFPNLGNLSQSLPPGLEMPLNMPVVPMPSITETSSATKITILKSITPITTGHMNLWLSCRLSDIIEYSMDLVTYEKYIAETTPTE
jgi:hypothetical protein